MEEKLALFFQCHYQKLKYEDSTLNNIFQGINSNTQIIQKQNLSFFWIFQKSFYDQSR